MTNNNGVNEGRIAVIMGIPFHNFSWEEGVNDVKGMVGTPKPGYLANVDLHFAVEVNKNDHLKNFVFYAGKVFCNSVILAKIAEMFGVSWLKRMGMEEMIPELIRYCEEKGYRVYLFGSSEEELEGTLNFLRQKYPNLVVAGSMAKPEGEVQKWNSGEISLIIENAQAQLLLCALGEENNAHWIGTHYKNYKANLTVPVGGDFGYVRGVVKMRNRWWMRLLLHPLRYGGELVRDIVFLYKEMRIQQREIRKLRTDYLNVPASDLASSHLFHKLVWSGKIEQVKLADTAMPPDYSRNVVCECTGVSFIDSSGLGQIAHLQRTSARYGKFFCLYKPSEAVVNSLRAMHLDKHIVCVWSPGELEDELKKHEESLILVKIGDNGHDYIFKPLVDLKDKTAKKLKNDVFMTYPTLSKYGKIVIDLEYVDFIDSAAVGTILSIKNQLNREGISLKLIKVHGSAQRTLETLKLYGMLVSPVDLRIV